MTVTTHSPIRTGPNAWRLQWKSNQENPLYRVYRNGTLIMTTILNHSTFQMDADEANVVEVLDDDRPPTEAMDPRATLAWAPVANTAKYRVTRISPPDERLIGLVADSLSPRMRVRALSDDADDEYQITAIGTNGNESTAKSAALALARHPDPPRLNFSFDDATKKVTIGV